MTLKARCECSTCDACPNPPDRSGTCANCFNGQPEFGDPEGSHAPMSDRQLDEDLEQDEMVGPRSEAAYRDGRVCYICGIEDVDTTQARLGDVAGQVTAIADRIVNVCGVGKCDA